jgi:hypothetical protein
MNTPTSNDKRKDVFDDPRLAAFIRFHNLCLAGQDGVERRQDIFLELKSPNAIGWQRGTDRLVLINKAAEPLPLRDVATTLKPGRYIEVHEGWPLDVQANGSIQQWNVPAQTAVMFVPHPSAPIEVSKIVATAISRSLANTPLSPPNGKTN